MSLSDEQKAELERRGWEWMKPSYTQGKWFKMRTNGNVVLNTASVCWSNTDDGRWEGWHGKGDASLIAEFMSIVEGHRLVKEEVVQEWLDAKGATDTRWIPTTDEKDRYRDASNALASALSGKDKSTTEKEGNVDGEVTLTLLRPLITVDWCEQGAIDGPTLPVGTTLTIPFTPGATVVSENPYGEAHHEQALWAAAEVPCPHLKTDSCDAEHGGDDYFICDRFDRMEERDLFKCRGDMCRCPSSKVRAEAAFAKKEEKWMSEWYANGRHVIAGDYANEGEPDVLVEVQIAEDREEEAKRIALCYNLCQGIPLGVLESGQVAVVTTEDYRLMERALQAALRCLPDPDRPTDVYAMANPFAVAVTVKEALSRIQQNAPTPAPKPQGNPLIRHGKCDYCGNERAVRPTPILADAAEGALTCESCWNVTREGGIATEGIDVGEFWDVGQKPSGGE